MAGKKDIVEQALKLIMGVGEEIFPHQRAENLSRFVSGSKLLDDAGNPQRLYHITNKDFDVFKPGGEDPTISGPAIWLSPYAEKQPAMHNVGSGSGFKEGTNVMPVYASIKNPLVLDTPEMQDWARTVFANKSSEFPYLISPEAKKAMQDEGYDGIILSGGSGVDNDEVIAFEGNQIKSAIGNTGAYDPTDPRIDRDTGGRIAKGPGGIIDDVVSMAGKLVAGEGEQAAKTGIRAYHGSPHDFDKFDMSKIGTGEGAQAYGHGLYKAQKSDIGRGYRDSIMAAQGIDPEMKIGKTPINDFYNNMEQRLARIPARQAEEGYNQLALLEDLAYGGDVLYIREKAAQGAYSPQTMDWFEKTISPQFNRKGRLYEINIAADPNTFLDWDREVANQSPEVSKILKKLAAEDAAKYGEGGGLDYYIGDPESYSGESFYRYLGSQLTPTEASAVLREAGIPGIKYLDAGSRVYDDTANGMIKNYGSREKALEVAQKRLLSSHYSDRAAWQKTVDALSVPETRNYVVFDDKLISIIRKYGIAGASAMLGYNLMENLDSKQALAATMADREYQDSRPQEADGGRIEKNYGGKAIKEALRIAQEGIERLSKGEGKTPQELLGGFANQKPRVPFEEWRYEYEPAAELLPSKEFDPSALKPGDVVIPLTGDRTSTGRKITSIAGEKLETPAITEGGPDYMRGPSQQGDSSVWASGKGVITGLNRRIENAVRAAESVGYKDPNIYGAYVAMGPQSGDFSTHTAEAVMGMIPSSKIKRADVKEFDARMRERFSDWPGLMSPKAADYVVNANAGEHRKAFLDTMDAAYWRDKGFPDVSLARYATTTPELVSSPTEAAGYNIARIIPGVKPEIITKPHRSYPSTMHGEYVGGLPPGLQRDDVFTQFSRKFDADAPERNYVMAKRRSFGMDPNAFQVMDEPEIQALIDKVKRIKQGYAEGGSVEDEDSWLDAAMTVARNAADKATFGTSKYAAAGADYLTDAALDALGYENDADFDRALAEQEYAMKEGEEKNPAAAGAGDIIGYVAPYLAIGPAEGALTTLGYLSDYGGKVGKTGSLFARALGFADGGEVPEQGYLESVGTAINQAANPVRRLIGVRTVDLPEGVDEVDYEELMNLAADVLDKSMMGFGGADPYAKRPKKFPVSPTGKIVDRVLPEEDDIDGALRIAKDVGGGLTPEEVGRRAAQDPATFDAIMQKYAIPDRDIAEYEALKSTVAKQPQDIQQMTHVGAPPMRDVKVDMPLFGGEYNIGSAPYNVAPGMAGVAQTAYDLKTLPMYAFGPTKPLAAGMDVAEGIATGDPTQAALAIAFGPGGKLARAAGIGASSYGMDPAEAQAGRERFFSKLLRTAEELPMEKMTGQQALAMLRKGTSPEELRWTGTEDFLANTPQVTKQNLIDYINKNRVQLNEITLGGNERKIDYLGQVDPDILEKYKEKIQIAKNEHQKALDNFYSKMYGPEEESSWVNVKDAKRDLTELESAAIQEMRDRVGVYRKPKYDEYSTLGGENYRENLFALPQRDVYTPFVEQMRKDIWQANYNEAIAGGFDEGRARKFADSFNQINLSPDKMAKFLGREDELKSVYEAQKSFEPQYKGGHWGDVSPDVLFHTRTSELTYEPPGANRPYRVHNVEETQSDPGQAGRKRGFKDQKAMAEVARLRQNTQELREKLKSEQARIHAEHQERMAPYVEARTNYERELRDKYKRGEISLGDMNRLAFAYFSPESELTRKFRSDTDQIVNPLRNQIVANENEIARIGKNIGDIPAMPYVTSTEKWTDFAIKKELDRAFDNGSDYFSWTPGEAQAERFDLSRHISKIEYSPDDGSLLAYDPNGRMVVNEGIGDPSELDEYVGKELADKIRAEEKSRDYSIGDAYEVYKDEETGEWAISLYGEQSYDDYGDPLVFNSKGEAKDYLRQMKADEYRRNPISLSGLDLKVGGEGMRGYYDKLYLKRVQNVLKESTGIKPEIEVIEVNTPDGPRKQLGVRLTDEMREKARFSDFNKGGRVTGGNTYGNDKSIANALALTREY